MMYRGTLRPPPSNKKKIIIITVLVLSCLTLAAVVVKKIWLAPAPEAGVDDFFGPQRRREWNDNNMPNPQKQTAQQILAYMDSAAFRQLTGRQQFEYMRAGGGKVMEYQMETYFSLSDDKQKTAYLDQIIDRMQAMRQQLPPRRPDDANRPPRRRDANEPNDPNRSQWRQFAARATPSNMRARSERGTPLQRAQRQAFFEALRQRMQQRGINPPTGPGGRGGGRP
jgi:hypothetical protein